MLALSTHQGLLMLMSQLYSLIARGQEIQKEKSFSREWCSVRSLGLGGRVCTTPAGLLVQCIPGTFAARASFSLCPPWAAVPLIKGLATLAMQGSELQAFCSHPTPTLGLIGAPGQCLCWKSQCLDKAEIMDHWCHELIKDSGRQFQGEGHRFFPPRTSLVMHDWLQAEKDAAANSPYESDKWGSWWDLFRH